jgi:hypothetical protein
MIGAMIKIKGEAFAKKLKAQDIRVYTVSSAALVDLVASGELGASFHIYSKHAMVSAKRGSAVSWVPMELVPTNSGCVGLGTQHPRRTAPVCSSIFSSAPSRARCWRNFDTVIRRITCRSSAGTLVSVVLSNSLRKIARSGNN